MTLRANTRLMNLTISRSYYWKFTRTRVPPLPEPRESPYIVGPYLKPDYLPTEYVTEAIKPRFVDDFDHYIYVPEKIEPDETRRVKLLLVDDVEGLGVIGQVVDAPYRMGASKLVAMKKAVYYNEFASSWYKFGPKTHQSASTALSPRTVRLLSTRTYTLPIKRETQVMPWHISLALRLSGCLCPVDAIVEDSICEHQDGGIKCEILVNNHERVEVKFAYNDK